jgi:predicted esterase
MVDVEVQSLATTVHGRQILRRGDPGRLLVGFHGYAENAEKHLAQLTQIPGTEEWTLLSVEALHPFYNMKSGEVVSSWMTRQGREDALLDNIAYVHKVIERFAPRGKTVFAGFSQGASMAWRAAASNPCNGVLVLGGDIPPDVTAQESWHLPKVLLGRGVRDEWYTDEKLMKDLNFLRARSADFLSTI